MGVIVFAAALHGVAQARPEGSEWAEEPIKPLLSAPQLDARKVALGGRLFEDRRLSGNGTKACVDCHDVHTNGASARPRDIDPLGRPMLRNTPTLFNSAANFRQFWDGHRAGTALAVDEVMESGQVMQGNWPQLLHTLRADTALAHEFAAAFPDGVQQANVLEALTQFLLSLRTPGARIDRYLSGDRRALTVEEQLGYQRFKAYGCVACHQGANIGGNMFQVMGVVGEPGAYFAGTATANADLGRFAITRQQADRYVFRVPSLRNVAVTAPYFHDGSAATLDDAVRAMFKYQLGRNPSREDVDLVVRFLGTLTGEYQGRALTEPGKR